MTLFPNHGCCSAQRHDLTLHDLAVRMLDQPVIPTRGRNWSIKAEYDDGKSEQRMISLALFGDATSDGGSLKTNANLIALTGVMLDVDPSKLRPGQTFASVDRVVGRLRERGIYSLVRESTGDRTRGAPYHVLFPFSRAMSAGERLRFARWVNWEILEGAVDPRADRKAQGFYYGRLQGRNDQVVPTVVDGGYIDLVVPEDELGAVPNKAEDERPDPSEWLVEPDLPRNVAWATAWVQAEARQEFPDVGGDRRDVALALRDRGISEATALDLILEHWMIDGDVEKTQTKVATAYLYADRPAGNADPLVEFQPSDDLSEDIGERPAPAVTDGGTTGTKDGATKVRGRVALLADDEDFTPEPELIRDTIPQVGVGFLGGQSGAFKTFAAVDLSASVATGDPFAGRRVEKTGGVIFCAFEGASTIRGRLKARRSRLRDPKQRLPISIVDRFGPVTTDKDFADFAATVRCSADDLKAQLGASVALIVIDTVTAAGMLPEDKENDPAAWQRVFFKLEPLAARHQCVIVLVHHAGKSAAAGLRGSSAARAAADFVLMLSCDRDELTGVSGQRTLALTKSRGGPEGIIAAVEAVQVEIGKRADGSPVTSLVLDYVASVAPRSEGKPERVLRAAYDAVVDEVGSDTVTLDAVREEFGTLYGGARDATRKAFLRARRSLAGVLRNVEVDGVECIVRRNDFEPSASDEFDAIDDEEGGTTGHAGTSAIVPPSGQPHSHGRGAKPRPGGTVGHGTFP